MWIYEYILVNVTCNYIVNFCEGAEPQMHNVTTP